MTLDTTPLKKVIQAWRDLNAERTEAMATVHAQATTGDDVERLTMALAEVNRLNDQELFRLRDIAGEAMQLVDEVETFATSTHLTNAQGQPLVAVKLSR